MASPEFANEAPTPTSVGAKLLNLFVSPGMVFEEVAASAGRPANWVVPTLLVCLSGLATLNTTTDPGETGTPIAALTVHWQMISRGASCLEPFAGILWSAFVIWLMGRFFLKSRFPFSKALEVAGLSSTIMVLGAVVTGLLTVAAGDASARPGLSLLFFKLPPANSLRAASEVLNGFYLWTTTVLTIGLSRLSGVSFKESAWWVFGYWVVARIGLILLA